MSVSSMHSSQRSAFRGEEMTAPPPNMDASQEQQRSSGGSARSSGSRNRQNPQQQLSTIEKSVTHLLVATKQLLETLTQWSRGSASEGEVSDVYVRLGYEFNIACRAFGAIGVDTSDLGNVPDLLRGILEDTLSQEASQASLDKYLPRIRDIIINLLHGLKKKQQRLRQKGSGSSKDGGEVGIRPPRQASVASNMSAEGQLAQQLEGAPERSQSGRPIQRQGSGDLAMPDLPPRTTSASGNRQSPRRVANLSPQNSMHQTGSRETMASDSASSMSSNAMQNIPVIAPYPEQDIIPTNQAYDQIQSLPSPEPPRPPPKQNDALSALQKGGDLERRASRRFSAYQIQKHLGTSMNGIAAIPPAQNSPIPNRGRDVRESLSAVRSRGSVMHSRARSRNQGGGGGGGGAAGYEPSPNRLHEVRRISEEPTGDQQTLDMQQPPAKPFAAQDEEFLESPIIKTPEDKLGAYPFPDTPQSPHRFGATLNGPLSEPFYPPEENQQPPPERRKTPTPARKVDEQQQQQRTPPSSSQQFVPEGSPQPGKELTLFLQYKSKIKKFVLPDGGDLSLARLQLAFIEKFQWNTHNNGVDLPEIYIQDSVSGVRHELEDLVDVRERSVLVLNVEALDEVKRHFDDGIGGLRRIVEGIRSEVEEQGGALRRVGERQMETAKEIAGIAAAPPPPSSTVTPSSTSTASSATSGGIGNRSVAGTLPRRDKASQLTELSSLRRDLAVVRQTYTSFVSDMHASMTSIRSKASTIKKTSASTTIPDMDSTTGRAYVNKGKKQLSDDSEKIVNRVDDLQDLVEDLRKDVVTRGVRPLPRQLEAVSKDISTATRHLKLLQEFLRREKPVWTKIWERELQVVCDDRDLLTLQEELAVDLEDDLEKAAATFALVEQATKQQNLQKPGDPPVAVVQGGGGVGGSGGAVRSTSRGLNPLAIHRGADPHKAKDSVLGEVRALQPNHESRLEAIERAEKARQRELESRSGGEFSRELGSFVEEGRLKKTGGVEEVERLRLLREERARREVAERLVQRMRERAGKEAGGAGGGGGGVNGEVVNGGGGGEVLEVPGRDGERERESHSPEVGFVDAKEDVGGGVAAGE